MRRREYASLAGTALLGLTGCLTATGDEPTDTPEPRTETPTATETSTPLPERDVSVTVDSLQTGLVRLNTDYLTVAGRDEQHLFLRATVDGEPPPLDAFRFRLAGAEYHPVPPEKMRMLWRFREGDTAYTGKAGGGILLFSLPKYTDADAPEASLSWPDGEWRPDERLHRRLGARLPVPSFSLSVPETVEVSTAPTVELSVTNSTEITTRFVAGLNRAGPMTASRPLQRFSIRVPPGETRNRTYRDDDIPWSRVQGGVIGDGEPDAVYSFYSTGGERRKKTRFVYETN